MPPTHEPGTIPPQDDSPPLLRAHAAGGELREFFSAVYEELRRVAHRHLGGAERVERRRADHRVARRAAQRHAGGEPARMYGQGGAVHGVSKVCPRNRRKAAESREDPAIPPHAP